MKQRDQTRWKSAIDQQWTSLSGRTTKLSSAQELSVSVCVPSLCEGSHFKPELWEAANTKQSSIGHLCSLTRRPGELLLHVWADFKCHRELKPIITYELPHFIFKEKRRHEYSSAGKKNTSQALDSMVSESCSFYGSKHGKGNHIIQHFLFSRPLPADLAQWTWMKHCFCYYNSRATITLQHSP